MIWTRPTLLFLAAFLGVWAEARIDLFRDLLGAQVHTLPALMVCTALNCRIETILAFALCGGLWFDSLSANPLGVTVIPLLLIGVAIKRFEALLLRDLPYAQLMLGVGASLLTPLLTLGLLVVAGRDPLVGWATFWQLAVMALGGGVLTPLVFRAMSRLDLALNYSTLPESSFRPDREIKRGRS
jgi:cell shape-determining protein MreD